MKSDKDYFIYAIKTNDIFYMKLLIKKERVDPSFSDNYPIRLAFKKGYVDSIDLLWKDNRVKKSLKLRYTQIYNELMKVEVENKLVSF